MKIPYINWIPFDKSNPPGDLILNEKYLIFLKEDDYDNGATWRYSVDVAEPYGNYISDFWDTETDWCEGQQIEVIAYAELPFYLKESDLIDIKNDDCIWKDGDYCLIRSKCHRRPVYCDYRGYEEECSKYKEK